MFRSFITFVALFITTGYGVLASSVPTERQLNGGKRAFSYCVNCHTLNPEAPVRMGPHLYGIIGRKIASQPDFDYSQALEKKTGVWTEREFDKFVTKPRHAIEGTSMPYRGLLSPHAREDLIAYLKYAASLDPNSFTDDDISSNIDDGDANLGAKLAERCLACHSLASNGKHSIGPNLLGVYGRNIASAPGFDYTQRLIRRKGVWDSEQLNAFIFESKKFDQGSHAAFLSLGRLSDRADIIAWLKSLK